MIKMPFVSVIIVTTDRPRLIKMCVELVLAQKYHPYEIIVVDGSKDDLTKNIIESFKSVKYIRSDIKNTPDQRNYGIKKAEGEIIAFIDDDSMVQGEWLENLIKEYKSSDIGGVGGLVIGQSEIINNGADATGKILDNGKLAANFNYDSNQIIEADHLMGCNMSFRKDVLYEIGLYDPEYRGTCFCEETDVCTRVKKKGYKIIYTPHAKVRHLAAPRLGHSRDRYNLKFQYFHARNKTYFYFKNYGLKRITLNFILSDTCDHLKSYIGRIIHTLALISLNIYGKLVGFLLAIRRLIHRHKVN